ncbi:MAG: hypothetical protein LUD29_05910 [Clostridia bacterium]|nr:hypothetical protein [Clostridia bacterium]
MRLKTKIMSAACALALGIAMTFSLGACGSRSADTTNTLFFYPLNYYGLEGRGFTERWRGMRDALNEYGWTVTGDGQKDSLKFKVSRDADCPMPADTRIVMVNNQTWDTGLALTDPLAEYRPLAVISTCNGVEFCSQQIESWSPSTQNATMGGFSEDYEEAFRKGTLRYLAAKYSACVAPVVGLIYNAMATGERLVDENGWAPNLTQGYWAITSYEEYMEATVYDNIGIDGSNPTIMKADMDEVLPYGNPDATFETFASFCERTATYEGVKGLYEGNRDKTDTVGTTKYKVGVLTPGSMNESVQAYYDYMTKYAAGAYGIEFVNYSVSGTVTQVQACTQACNAGCRGIISIQDDLDRVEAIKYANERGVFFAVAGCAVADVEYEDDAGNMYSPEYTQVKDLPYFAGAVGASLSADRAAAYEMTKHYLRMICERGEM